MSEASIHILSTRPLPAELINEAAGQGIYIDARPFITTERVEDASLEKHVRELALRPLVAVFTSMNAVEAVGEIVKSGAEWTIFCIGSATRRLVASHFGEATIAGTAESAKALAETIVRQTKPKEVFFFCGDQRRDELPEVLRTAGFTLNELIVYRTSQRPVKTEREYDGIAFFSPSAVESFFSVNTVSAGTILFAIGRTTGEAIRMRCGNVIIVSNQPDKTVMIRQVIDHFQIKNSQR